jgi:Protein of unknown function (DUF3365)
MKFYIISFAVLSVLIFSKCKNEKATTTLTGEERTEYLAKGQNLAAATFSELSERLQAALKEEGVAGALQYCNAVASPLVDSLSKASNATIRRTSLKTRNTGNAPADWELTALRNYEKKAAAGEELNPAILPLDEHRIAFMAPIKMLPLCLKCHGQLREDIAAADAALIKNLYPGDQATGYRTGDLRGLWSITFSR